MVGNEETNLGSMEMILYGRNMSPFVRRVAIWCALQGRQIERRELMVSGPDFEEIKAPASAIVAAAAKWKSR